MQYHNHHDLLKKIWILNLAGDWFSASLEDLKRITFT